MSFMNRERCWELMARKLANEASAAELRELAELLRHFPDMQYAGELLGSIRQVNKPVKSEAEVAAFMDLVGSGAGEDDAAGAPATGKIRRLRLLKWSVAAALAGVAAVTAFWLFYPSGAGSRGRHNEIVTRNGSRTSIELPDGSTVKLNAGSKLTYEDGFGTKDRVVTLEGEAFFDVKADPAHPFIVNTRLLKVRVLGTAFNVSTYNDVVETVLLRGKVEVELNNQADSRIVLKPLEKIRVAGWQNKPGATVDRALRDVKYQVSAVHKNEEINDYSETAWLNNRLVFKDESLGSLSNRMERWFNVHIEISGEALKQEELTGVFQNENIIQALNALQVITAFNYRQSSDTIFIQPK